MQTKRKIYCGSDNGLRDIVCKAHLAVKPQIAYRMAELPVLVQDNEGSDKYQCESEFLTHVKSCSGRLLHNGVILHDKVFQRVQRRKRYGSYNQGLHPYTEVALR